jgi:hypothetical protein
VRILSRRSGDWQSRTWEGDPSMSAEPNLLWAFVDLSVDPTRFFLVRERDIRRDIHQAHQEYLARHGGHRAQNPTSDHHKITTARVRRLAISWSALGME